MGAPTANGSALIHHNGSPPPAASWSVEVVYRGIFQKRLANRISRGVVLGARKEGKVGTAFARYGDSPERNGVPAKNFAVVATDEVELESSLARYEPTSVDVSIVVDDTMCKGIESWAWYGIQPINKLVVPGGSLLVTSDRDPDDLLTSIKVKAYAYDLVVVPSPVHAGVFAPEGTASFVAPRCLAIETATAIPRALKLCVGFCASSLTQRFETPSLLPNRAAGSNDVPPSPNDTGSTPTGNGNISR